MTYIEKLMFLWSYSRKTAESLHEEGYLIELTVEELTQKLLESIAERR